MDFVSIFVIAGGIVLAFFVIFVVFPFIGDLIAMLQVSKRNREAKKLNAKARALRLQRTHYDGWPLPVGDSGELRITVAQQLALPAKGGGEVERIYLDRARDMGVDIHMFIESDTQDLVIIWKKSKVRNPKEHYS